MSVPGDQMWVNLLGTGLHVNDPTVADARQGQGANQINAPTGKGVSGTQDQTEHLGAKQGDKTQPNLPSPSHFTSVDDAILMLMALRSKIGDQQQQISVSDIKNKQAEQTEEHKKRLEQLQEAAEKMDKAKKSGTFGKIFGWIATIATVVAAAVMIATGVGAVVGGLLIAGAAIGLGMQIAQQIPAARDWMAKNPAFGYVMMAVQLVLAVATMGAGFASAASSTAEEAVEVAADAAQAAENAGEIELTTISKLGDEVGDISSELSEVEDLVELDDLSDVSSNVAEVGDDVGNVADIPESTMEKIARIIKRTAAVTAGGAQVGAGSSEIATGVYTSQAEKAQAEAKKIEAELIQSQAQIDDELHRLRNMMKEIDDGFVTTMQIMNNMTKTKQFVIHKMNV